jgi:enamine deaminase RidA (YjgF/YER057c/UK114 family)
VDTITITASGATNSPQTAEVTLTINPQVPVVVATSPIDGTTGIPIDANITATFSINMDPGTIDDLSVLVHTGGDEFYSGTVTYDLPSKTMTFDPDTTFYKGERIFVELTTDIQSLQGVPLADSYIFDFYVETNTSPYIPSDPVPANGAEDISVNTDLSWSGGDPDGDDVHYTLYFGTSNPPSSFATDIYDSSYDLPELEYDTRYFWYLKCYDGYGGVSTMSVCNFNTELNYVCGDANGDLTVDISDAVNIINFVFIGGAGPDPYESGDANCDGTVDISDAVWIVNFVFISGNTPCDTNGDDIPDC